MMLLLVIYIIGIYFYIDSITTEDIKAHEGGGF